MRRRLPAPTVVLGAREDGWVGVRREKIVTVKPEAVTSGLIGRDGSHTSCLSVPRCWSRSCACWSARSSAAQRPGQTGASSRRATRPRSRRTRRRPRAGSPAACSRPTTAGRSSARASSSRRPSCPGGRGVLTDDSGVFDLTELPAGRYTLDGLEDRVSSSLSYGQRRPLQAGTPLQLADGQQLQGHRVPAAARQRHRGPRARRRRRRRCRARWCASCATSTSRASAGSTPAGNGADRRQGPVPRLGPDAGRLLRQRDRARRAASAAAFGGPGGGPGGFGGGGPADAVGGPAERRPGGRRRSGAGRYAPTYYPGRRRR